MLVLFHGAEALPLKHTCAFGAISLKVAEAVQLLALAVTCTFFKAFTQVLETHTLIGKTEPCMTELGETFTERLGWKGTTLKLKV
jgi:hypothetical protein